MTKTLPSAIDDRSTQCLQHNKLFRESQPLVFEGGYPPSKQTLSSFPCRSAQSWNLRLTKIVTEVCVDWQEQLGRDDANARAIRLNDITAETAPKRRAQIRSTPTSLISGFHKH